MRYSIFLILLIVIAGCGVAESSQSVTLVLISSPTSKPIKSTSVFVSPVSPVLSTSPLPTPTPTATVVPPTSTPTATSTPVIFFSPKSSQSSDTNNIKLVKYTEGAMQAISVVNNYAYVENGYGMAIFDVGNPFTPVKVGEVSLPYPYNGYPYNIFVDDNYAYIAAVDHGLRIIDISNPIDPVEVGHYDISNWAMDIVVVDNYAYISTGIGGGGSLRIIDISNPESPIEIGHHDLSGGGAESLALIDNYTQCATLFLRVRQINHPNQGVYAPTVS